VTIALLQSSLGRHIDHETRRNIPSFFFVDIQPDQREPIRRVVSELTGATAPIVTPVVQARLTAINGAPITRAMIDRRRAQGDDQTWYLTRAYMLTWASEAPTTNVVTRGRWWTDAEAVARPRASVEEEAATHLGVDVGSTLTFEIQGTPIEAEVMSLRKVDWQSLSTNFFVIFSQGALERAPRTYVATVRVPSAAESSLQDAVASAFPNVTAIAVRDILERAARTMDRIAAVVRGIAAASVATGLIVMAGALATSRYQRLYESVVLRAVGATRGAVARAFAVEYACLGAAAGVGGSLIALILAWILSRFVLNVPWSFGPGPLALGIVMPILLALAVGFLTTFRLVGAKPLAVLREE
jgi:putative ABC transport system permease protein